MLYIWLSARGLYTLNFLLEETIAVYGLLESNVFKDFPNLKIVCSHGGGAFPTMSNASARRPFAGAKSSSIKCAISTMTPSFIQKRRCVC